MNESIEIEIENEELKRKLKKKPPNPEPSLFEIDPYTKNRLVGYQRTLNVFFVSGAAVWTFTYLALKILLLYLGISLIVPLWAVCLVTAVITIAISAYVAYLHHDEAEVHSGTLASLEDIKPLVEEKDLSFKQKALLVWDKIHTFLIDSYAIFTIATIIVFLVTSILGVSILHQALFIGGAVAIAYGIFSTSVKHSESNRAHEVTLKLKNNFNTALEKVDQLIESRRNTLKTVRELHANYNWASKPACDQLRITEIYIRSKEIATSLIKSKNTQPSSKNPITEGMIAEMAALAQQTKSLGDFAEKTNTLQELHSNLLIVQTLNATSSSLEPKKISGFYTRSLDLYIKAQKNAPATLAGSPIEPVAKNTDTNVAQLMLEELRSMLSQVDSIETLELGYKKALAYKSQLLTAKAGGEKQHIDTLMQEELTDMESKNGEDTNFTEWEIFQIIFALFYGEFKAGAFVYIAVPIFLDLIGVPALSTTIFWGIIVGVALVYGIIHALYTSKSIEEEKWLTAQNLDIVNIEADITAEMKMNQSSQVALDKQDTPEPSFFEHGIEGILNKVEQITGDMKWEYTKYMLFSEEITTPQSQETENTLVIKGPPSENGVTSQAQ